MFNQLCQVCECLRSYDWETGLREDDVTATYRHFLLFVLAASVSTYLHFIIYNKRFYLIENYITSFILLHLLINILAIIF